MIQTRRTPLNSITLAVAAVSLCALGASAFARDNDSDEDEVRPSRVFTSSNASAGNQLLVYNRAADGSLTLGSSISTGGLGTGAGLGSQGAVTLSRDGRFVFVVNAGSNTVSTFRLTRGGPVLTSTVDSGGQHPISVTEMEGVVYALNDAGNNNVTGFRNTAGTLKAIAGSTRSLSVSTGATPAQVGFSDDGDALVVTEKATNKITSYPVAKNGSIGVPVVIASPGQTPFGFAFNRRNRLIVSEAWGGAAGASTVSSYRFSESSPAKPVVASAAVADTQSAACWVSISPNGRYAYVSNTQSTNVSSYLIANNGQIGLVRANAGSTGAGSLPADSAVTSDGRHLYVRNGGSFTISSFEIGPYGGLKAGALTANLPAAAVGLAAD